VGRRIKRKTGIATIAAECALAPRAPGGDEEVQTTEKSVASQRDEDEQWPVRRGPERGRSPKLCNHCWSTHSDGRTPYGEDVPVREPSLDDDAAA